MSALYRQDPACSREKMDGSHPNRTQPGHAYFTPKPADTVSGVQLT
jgi:hypothetical protein